MIGADSQTGAFVEPGASPASDALEHERNQARLAAIAALYAVEVAAAEMALILMAPAGPRGTLSEETVPAVVAGDERLNTAMRAAVDALFKVGVIQNAEGIA